jgi:hypothetical protein
MATPTDKKLYDNVKEYVKSRVSRWPSAYASGMLVNLYKKIMNQHGKQPYKEKTSPMGGQNIGRPTGLTRWYNEKWIDIKTNLPCGKAKTKEYYPTCRPSVRVTSKSPVTASELSDYQKKKMIQKKQKAKESTVRYKYLK